MQLESVFCSVGAFVPEAAGARRDLREGTDLGREVPFFDSADAASTFVAACLPLLRQRFPTALRYVDYGGGQGTLALAVDDALRAMGHVPTTTVLDSNAFYLERSAERGLHTELANIEDCRLCDVGFGTMRLVCHYCSEKQQRRMLERIYAAASSNGLFVSQIETGEKGVCELQSAIANLLGMEGADGYYWPTLEGHIAMLEAVGFQEIRVIAETPPSFVRIGEALATAFRRFHGSRVRATPVGNAQIGKEREAFFRAALRLVEQLMPRGGLDCAPAALLARQYELVYPIVACHR